MVSNSEDAMDIVQDVFLKAYQARPNFAVTAGFLPDIQSMRQRFFRLSAKEQEGKSILSGCTCSVS